jgi:hypothetical protein
MAEAHLTIGCSKRSFTVPSPSGQDEGIADRPEAHRVSLRAAARDHIFMTSGGPPYCGPCAVPPLKRCAERPRLAAGAVVARPDRAGVADTFGRPATPPSETAELLRRWQQCRSRRLPAARALRRTTALGRGRGARSTAVDDADDACPYAASPLRAAGIAHDRHTHRRRPVRPMQEAAPVARPKLDLIHPRDLSKQQTASAAGEQPTALQ